MHKLGRLAKRFEFAERILPPRWQLPARYHGQKLARALEPEFAVLPQLVTPGDVALDVGANRGVYAYALAQLGSTVHCFEPLAECSAYIASYGSPKIQVHTCALSDRAGVLELHIPRMDGRLVLTRASLDRPEGAFELRQVTVRTLDSFGLSRVDFAKIDVEGEEASVLRGAEETFTRHHPRLLVEIDRGRHTETSFAAVIALLESWGYGAHVVERERLRTSERPWKDAVEHVNFIFLPR